jgi:hypothetical protein
MFGLSIGHMVDLRHSLEKLSINSLPTGGVLEVRSSSKTPWSTLKFLSNPCVLVEEY